ncbi:hypothetical protein QQM79_15520 [Marinobacteraceae bacterium S3BR75-40.1]
MLNRLFRRQAKDEADATPVGLERVGRSHIDELAANARRVPWSLTALQLLWTAGPVTYLAMQGGSFLGYGEPVSTAAYLFFAFYVVIAAIIGLIARVVADSTRGRKQARARANLTRTLDIVPDLLFTVYDLHLTQLTPLDRQREAAATVLRRMDLGPSGVGVAVEDLTGDPALGNWAQRIEIYRRAGMFSRVDDCREASRERTEAAVERVRATSADVAGILETRLAGHAPSQEEGVARGANFIDQIFTAAHQDDLRLMSLGNVEDILLLTFELLRGRQIVRLIIDYQGDWELARALDQVEQSHSEYRLNKVTAAHHLRDLADALRETGLTDLNETVQETATLQLLEQTHQALADLARKAKRDGLPASRSAQLGKALRYARLTRQAVDKLEDRYQRYVRTLEHFEQLRQRQGRGSRKRRWRRRGLRIREQVITLEDPQKIEVADALCRYLDDQSIRQSTLGILRHQRALTASDAKRLGVQLALILKPLIELDDPSVQRAIENSRAPLLEGLEMGFSADAKAGLGAAVVKEVQQDMGPLAELIALRLAKLYRLPLTPGVIDFLATQYGANHERLQFIAHSSDSAPGSASMRIPSEPALVSQYSKWQRPIQEAERILTRIHRRARTLPAGRLFP